MHVNLPRTRTEATDRPAHAQKPSSAEKASAGNFGDLLKSAKDAAAAAPQTGMPAAASTAAQAASPTALL